MNNRRLCLRCLSAWMDEFDELCLTCQIEFESQDSTAHKSTNREPANWWGAVESDLLDPELDGANNQDDDTNYGLPWGFHLADAA